MLLGLKPGHTCDPLPCLSRGHSLTGLALYDLTQRCSANDLYPSHSGAAFGISNTLGTIPGVVSPLLTGLMLQAGGCPVAGPSPPSCGDAWTNVFLLSIGVFSAGLVVYGALL